MLTREEDVDAHALRRQGWTISAIARHLARDRKTIRAYLNGEVEAGQRRQAPDAFVPFLDYCRQRLADDPHLWARTLFDEVVELGYQGGYSTFTRALRRYGARPHCDPCQSTRGRDVAIIAHPPGEEIQFDWLELPDPPGEWAVGAHAHLLVGALAHSGRWRAVLAESEDFPHLVQSLDQYGVGVDPCPSRRGNRKGVVEKTNHSAAQRWWRALPDDLSIEQAQNGVDKLSIRMDARRRTLDGARTTVAELASAEPLLALPALPFPAELSVERTVTAQSLVPFEGNFYSVPPGLPGTRVTVTHRLGEDFLSIATAGRTVIARHRKAVRGSGQTIRDAGHVIALERSVLASASWTPALSLAPGGIAMVVLFLLFARILRIGELRSLPGLG